MRYVAANKWWTGDQDYLFLKGSLSVRTSPRNHSFNESYAVNARSRMASIMASLSLPFFIDRPLIIHPANSWRSNCSDALSAEGANAEYVEPEDESCHRKGDADKVTGQRPEASPVPPWISSRTPRCSNRGNMSIPLALRHWTPKFPFIPRSGYLYALMIPSLVAHVRWRTLASFVTSTWIQARVRAARSRVRDGHSL